MAPCPSALLFWLQGLNHIHYKPKLFLWILFYYENVYGNITQQLWNIFAFFPSLSCFLFLFLHILNLFSTFYWNKFNTFTFHFLCTWLLVLASHKDWSQFISVFSHPDCVAKSMSTFFNSISIFSISPTEPLLYAGCFISPTVKNLGKYIKTNMRMCNTECLRYIFTANHSEVQWMGYNEHGELDTLYQWASVKCSWAGRQGFHWNINQSCYNSMTRRAITDHSKAERFHSLQLEC